MKTSIISLLTLACILITQSANSQVRRDRLEKTADRIEITVSKKQLQRDIHELELFRSRSEEFKEAYLKADIQQVKILQEKLLLDMNREIKQSEQKTRSDQKEVTRSSREVSNSGSDIRQSRKDMSTRHDSRFDDKKDLRDDRRDRKDDIRDLNDDKRDLAVQSNRLATQKEIRNRFTALSYNGKRTGGEAIAEMKLLERFILSLESDIEATRKEIGEDRLELMEDRREIREDRRERRERK